MEQVKVSHGDRESPERGRVREKRQWEVLASGGLEVGTYHWIDHVGAVSLTRRRYEST